jgi:hypothetical protein
MIDIQSLPAGVYYIRLTGDEIPVIGKFIKE